MNEQMRPARLLGGVFAKQLFSRRLRTVTHRLVCLEAYIASLCGYRGLFTSSSGTDWMSPPPLSWDHQGGAPVRPVELLYPMANSFLYVCACPASFTITQANCIFFLVLF